MPADPEWFYSSLAQSAAAIVGLMGGVLGTRVLDRINVRRSMRIQIAPTIRSFADDLEADRLRFENQRLNLAVQLKQLELAKAGSRSTFYLAKDEDWLGNYSQPRNEVPIAPYEERLLRCLRILDEISKAYTLPEGITDQSLTELIDRLQKLNATAEGRLPEHHQHISWLKHIQQEVRRHPINEPLLPFLFVLLILLFLAGAGIIWPLSVLPGYSGSSKVGMLFAFSVGVISLLGFFAWQLWELHELTVLQWTNPRRKLAWPRWLASPMQAWKRFRDSNASPAPSSADGDTKNPLSTV